MVIGMPNSMVKKVISINIVYFDLGQGEDYVYHGTTNFIGIHKKDVLKLSNTEEGIYHTLDIAKIYLEYYIIKVNQFNETSENTLDEWIHFFKNQEVKEDTKAKGLKEAKEELDVMKLSPIERKEYEAYITDWRDNYGVIVGNYNKGKLEGKIEGKLEGKLEDVINMHKEGISIEIIARVTGLNVEEIDKIIENE